MPETGARDGMTPEERKKVIEERIKTYTEEEQKQYVAKKQRRKENKVHRQPPAVVRDWIRQQADSLVIASHFDPEQMLLKFLPYLACSKPFVIYSEFLEVTCCGLCSWVALIPPSDTCIASHCSR